jgi:NB-ARC domain/Rx N-terminal domain
MAMILDAFMPKFSKLLLHMVQDEVGMLLGVPGEIEKLEQTVSDIQCVLADAEKKQIESKAIERWLNELKDVMYDADDIMDLCHIKAQERLACSDSPSPSKLSRVFLHLRSYFDKSAFAHETGTKIREVYLRLEKIAKRKADLGLIQLRNAIGCPHDHAHQVDTIIRRRTDPVIVMGDIVGEKVEEDAGLLVSWLTGEEKSARENVSVVAIVGMGGIGKTTLAKRIFNDPRIQDEFTLKIWTCVSKEVKGVELLKGIIREAGGEHGAAQERWELVPLLQRLVHRKRFLLVLDDVWLESKWVWDGLLRDPLMSGAHGSRVLITSRDERVANAMRAAKSHRVERLSEEDGWSLLSKQVQLGTIIRYI